MNPIDLRLRIYEAMADDSLTATVSAEEVAERLGPPTASPLSVGLAFKALGFEQVQKQRGGRKPYCFCPRVETSNSRTKKTLPERTRNGQKNAADWWLPGKKIKPRGIKKWPGHNGNGCGSVLEKIPARWQRPMQWPELIKTQQRLKDMQVPAAAIGRHSRAAVVDDHLQRAVRDVVTKHGSGSAKRRGLLAAQIRETIEEFYEDSISLRDLADILGESATEKEALINRIKGLVRFDERSISTEDLAKVLKARPGSSLEALLTKIEVLVGK